MEASKSNSVLHICVTGELREAEQLEYVGGLNLAPVPTGKQG